MNVSGNVDAMFSSVRDMLGEVVSSQQGTGAAVAAWHGGRLAVDLWGGHADASRRRAWAHDSIVQPYSVTKPFAAICALRLVDTGRLGLDEPAQRYWPELTTPATVRQILSHQAGVVALDEPAPTESFYDWNDLCRRLAAQPPAWEPGTAHGESAMFYGHLVGELVRRVDGRSPGRFLRDEICGPLGLDFSVGLTHAEQARAVELTGLDEDFRTANMARRPDLYRRAVTNPPGAQDPAVVNGPRWRGAEVPAVNGHGTARAVAGFYHALCAGELISSGLLEEAVTAQCSGRDLVFGEENAWGLGFGVEGNGFGMGGLGGSYGGADRAGDYSFAFLTGHAGSHDRGVALENELRACIGLSPVE